MSQHPFQINDRIIDRNTQKAVPELPIEAMDKLERYRSCIQTLLEKHSQFQSRNEDVCRKRAIFRSCARSLSAHTSCLERTGANLLHRYTLRYQRWKNLASAQRN